MGFARACERGLGGSWSSGGATRDASGSLRDGGVMKPRTSRRGRLTRSAEFERVYRQGRSCGNRHLVLHTFPNPSSSEPRVGLSVSRRVGGAVERNKVKRALREAVRALGQEVGGERDLVVVARPEALQLVETEGMKGVQASLLELLARSAATEQRREAA